MKARTILLITSLPVFLVGPRASAQVEPGAWYFEIDGDYGSVLGLPTIPERYTLPSCNITDGAGADRHTTLAPKEGYRIAGGLPACSDWYHQTSATYMGAQAYRVEALYPGRLTLHPTNEEPRRSEQMLLAAWYTGTDVARYFTFAFRFRTLGTLPARTGGYISQWHQAGGGPPPVRLQWLYENGAYYLDGGVNKDSDTDNYINTALFLRPALPDVWYRMLFRVDLGPGWGEPGCEQCPSDQGSVSAWMMNAQTGQWELWAEYQGQIGYRYKWEDQSPPRRCRTGDELPCQWKVGHYANESEGVILDYDNVAYGKRWNAITKNKLIGYKKSVLHFQFDEGTGTVLNDNCWSWNGGQQGDATMDYDNDGSLQGDVGWSNDGVGFYRRSLYFSGGSVDVPMDTTDFDFGNYVTVSAWFNTTANAPQLQGLVSIDQDDGVGKLFLARADGLLTFGVRHPDGAYSQVNFTHDPEPWGYADGFWHHVVGTFNRFADDNYRVKLYVDGVRVDQREGYDKPILRGDRHLVVGKIGSSGGFLGNMDEVNVLNYAMTDAEVAAFTAQTLAPATRVWDGGSPSTGTWTADSNWQGNVRPATGDFLIFPAGAARLTNTNTFTPDKVFGGIIFQGDHYHIYGNAVTITNHVTAEAGASGNVFRPDLRLGAPSSFRAQGSGLQLALLGDVDLNGFDLTLSSQGQLDCEGAISGTGDVTKTGSGRVVFSGSRANTYSGLTAVYDGILELNKYLLLLPIGTKLPRIAIPGNLQVGLDTSSLISDGVVLGMFGQLATSAQVTVNATGELNLNGYGETILFLHLAGGHVTTGSGQLTVQGNIACDPDDDGSVISGHLALGTSATYVTVAQNATLVMSASVSGEPTAILTKQGPGELRLENSNPYGGRIVLAEGTVRAAANDALGSGTNAVTLDGGELILENATITGRTLTVEQASELDSRGSSCAWNGPMVLNANLEADVNSGNTLTCRGALAGPGDLRKSGPGRLSLTGPAPNSFDDFRMNQGELSLGKTPYQNAVPDTLSVGDDLGAPLSVVVRLNAPHQIGDASLLLLYRSAWLDLNGQDEAVGALSGTGQVSLGTGRLTVASIYGSSYDGIITGTGGLTRVGDGIFTLQGDCPYSGDTTVRGGFAVNGSLSNSPVKVEFSGRLCGFGRIHSLTVSAGGLLTPGPGPAILESLGAVSVTGGTNLVQIQGPHSGSGYDQLRARAAVTLNGAVLELLPAYDLPDGMALTILDKTSAGPVIGTFAGLPEGTLLTASNQVYRISYLGGDGNDVVLTRTHAPDVTNTIALLSSNQAQLLAQGLPGLPYVCEATPHLNRPIPWAPLSTNAADAQGIIEFIDTDVLLHPQRFYRIVSP